ncbi:GPP34 family phosphoprotein [Sphaerisporangium sp. NPDC051017]|uniref:GOLPH3/VPS74 family protein n=1 Tax=Sphaerisporangium sp. NPDC051017 TaxID=3154636 RepID=UPI00342D384B
MMVNVPDTLPERLYLLTYDVEKKRMTYCSERGYLMRAGILAELLLAGHIADATGGPVAQAKTVADPLLDETLQMVAASRRRTWQHWVNKGSGAAARQVRDRLESGGWIRVERGRVLGFIPRTKVTVRDTRVPKRLASTVASALRGPHPASRLDPRDAALAALAATLRLKTVMPRADWRARRVRGEELAEVVAPVPWALRKAIQAAQAAASAG